MKWGTERTIFYENQNHGHIQDKEALTKGMKRSFP